MAEAGGGSSSRPPGVPARDGVAEAVEPIDARESGRSSSSEPRSSSQGAEPLSGPVSERRSERRHEVVWAVDCETEDTFLYAAITNISELGIFVRTEQPLPVGTHLRLRFETPASEPAGGSALAFSVRGTVQWVNEQSPLAESPNPGMGIRFIGLSADDRERLVEVVRTIAYLRESVN